MPALARGPCAWLFLLPATRGLATFIIKPHVSSFSIHVWCDTLHTCLFYLLFVSWIVLIMSVPGGDWRGGRFQLLIHTTPALYYCVITHCTVYVLILMCTNSAIAFTRRREKIPWKIKTVDTWSIQVNLVTNRVAMVAVHLRLSALKSVAFISAHWSLSLAVSPADSSLHYWLPVHGNWILILIATLIHSSMQSWRNDV